MINAIGMNRAKMCLWLQRREAKAADVVGGKVANTVSDLIDNVNVKSKRSASKLLYILLFRSTAFNLEPW